MLICNKHKMPTTVQLKKSIMTARKASGQCKPLSKMKKAALVIEAAKLGIDVPEKKPSKGVTPKRKKVTFNLPKKRDPRMFI